MNFINWEDYNSLNSFSCPNFLNVSKEYIYTYPINWGPIDVLNIWNEDHKAWFPSCYSIYIHIPFCKEMCPFCTFCHIYWNDELAKIYIKCLKKEILFYAKHNSLKKLRIDSIYFGGGTSCLVPYNSLAELIKILLQEFHVSPNIEITIECNPVNASFNLLENIVKSGVNRISFGVQTFNRKLTRTLRIKARDPVAIKALEYSNSIGFENISIDLMYEIPNQGIHDFNNDIDIAIDLGVSGLSLYWLDLEGSALEKLIHFESDSKKAEELYFSGRNRILKKDFKQQTQTDFFKEVKCDYVDIAWKAPQGGAIGFGAGAITFFFNGYTYVNTNNVSEYIKLLQDDRLPVLGGIKVKKEQLMSKYPILGFKCISVPVTPFKQIFKIAFEKHFESALTFLLNLGLVVKKEDNYKLTEKGIWYVDNVSRKFFGMDNSRSGQPWARLLKKIIMPSTRRVFELPF